MQRNRLEVMGFLATKPAVRYLTKIRNSKELKGAGESYNRTGGHEGDHT